MPATSMNAKGKDPPSKGPAAPRRRRKPYIMAVGFVALLLILFLHTPEYVDPDSRTTKVELNPIRQISILGERNSGTRWTYE